MRDEPSMIDPYRTLGLQPGAPLAEVKKAYRRLAKAYHPDSAGEAALPRFLAIHEAYESIRTGRPLPAVRGGPSTRSGRASSEPWRADPDRARAAREQARRRAGGRSAGGAAASGAPSAGSTGAGARRASGRTGQARNGAGSPGAGSTGTSGPSTSGGRSGAGAGSGGRGASAGATGGTGRRRNTRKATMGSTSYDEARDPNDASWSGASWYGPSTGEYWIINPREYADPRKHGPEYQSRARRTADAGDADELPTEPLATARSSATGTATSTSRPDGWRFERSAQHVGATTAMDAGARRRTRARDAWGTTPPEEAAPGSGGSPRVNRGPDDQAPRGAGISPRELLGTASDDPVRRLGIALVAWPPIGLAAAALIGDATGCAAYSADCGGTEPLLPWLAQAVILGLLLLLPPVARVLAAGAIGILAALVPLTFFLVALGGTGAPQAGFALAFLLAIAWLVGVAWGLAEVRRRASIPRRARPGARA